jgi:lysophospholipase L1-like esterase
MSYLPYDLPFIHKFNFFKLLGFLIDDYDIPTIAKIYDVSTAELQHVEDMFNNTIACIAEDLKVRYPEKNSNADYTVIAIGDSITSDRESYLKILRKLWQDTSKRKTIDSAVSGDTTCNIINRFYSTVLVNKFDWAIIFLGTNDSRELNDSAGISFLSHDDFKKNMKYITESLLNREANIVHVTIPDADNVRLNAIFGPGNWRYMQSRIDQTNDFIRDLSRKYGTKLADLSKALRSSDKDPFEPDGLHLNAYGQTVLCELLLKILP